MIVDHEALRRVVSAVFRAAGSDDAEAALVARRLVEANLAGHDSHGVARVPQYIEAVQAGDVTPNRHAGVIADQGAILVVDGNGGYGHVVAGEATEFGIERVAETGVCVVALRNAHHIGRISHWAELCSAAGYASMHFVNSIGHTPLVAPFGGRHARISTNPFCAALPTRGGWPILLDMATAKVAEGKIRVARNKGQEVEDDTLLDPSGAPTNDPGVIYQRPRGAILPVGGHKGYGLGLFCELFAGALGGGGTMKPETEGAARVTNNMLSVIIDPALLTDAESYEAEVDSIVAWVKGTPPVDGGEGVLLPNEPEQRMRAERMADGIPIDAVTWGLILEAAETVAVDRERIAGMLAVHGAESHQ